MKKIKIKFCLLSAFNIWLLINTSFLFLFKRIFSLTFFGVETKINIYLIWLLSLFMETGNFPIIINPLFLFIFFLVFIFPIIIITLETLILFSEPKTLPFSKIFLKLQNKSTFIRLIYFSISNTLLILFLVFVLPLIIGKSNLFQFMGLSAAFFSTIEESELLRFGIFWSFLLWLSPLFNTGLIIFLNKKHNN